MKIDRPGAAIIGAVLMVAFRIVGAPEALSSLVFVAHLGPIAGAGLFLTWALLHRLYLGGSEKRVPVAQALSSPEFEHARIRKKPVVVLLAVLAGFLAGVPAALMAAVGAAL